MNLVCRLYASLTLLWLMGELFTTTIRLNAVLTWCGAKAGLRGIWKQGRT